MMVTLVLTEQIPSGKNQVRERWQKSRKTGLPIKVRFGDKRFSRWKAAAGMEVLLQRRALPVATRMALPFRRHLKMSIKYHEIQPVPAGGVRDATGMEDAIQHLLEYMEIIEDDGLIKKKEWEEVTDGPCATITLEEL